MGVKAKLKRHYVLIRRTALVGLSACLVLLSISYARALLAPNSPGASMRTAEWVRDMHCGWVLDLAEWCWFSVHKPSVDEVQATQLSEFPPPFARRRPSLHPIDREPPNVAVLFPRAMSHEGEWRAIGTTINGVPALRCTIFRPDPERPQVSVGVARFTPELTRFVIVPGTRDPAGKWRWHGSIPESERDNLLAAFNNGFRLRDAHGGLYAEGKVGRPLVVGAASLVIDQNGAPDIVAWKTEGDPPPEVAAVRQNLRLIVANGKVSHGLARNRGGAWGTLNHDLFMWRSGLGITADGALIYLAGEGLNLVMLAKAMQHAGAVRAMELDIHHYWPSFNVFQPAGPNEPKLVATKLLKNAKNRSDRYLTPDDRDFIAAFVR